MSILLADIHGHVTMVIKMGRVFTPEEVVRGHVPNLDAQQAATELFLGAVEGVIESPQNRNIGCVVLKGALVYGSTATGNTNRRSDLDVFGVYAERVPNTDALQNMVSIIEDETRVGVDLNLWPPGPLLPPHSTLDELFLKHLLTTPFDSKTGRGLDPLSKIREVELAISPDILFTYLGYKKRKLGDALLSNPAKTEPKPIQRALEIPKAISRKVFQLLEALGEIEGSVDASDSVDLYTRSREYFLRHNPRLWNHFDIAWGQDAAYTRVLEDTVEGRLSLNQYTRFYKNLGKTASKNALRLTLEVEDFAIRTFGQVSVK